MKQDKKAVRVIGHILLGIYTTAPFNDGPV
jgi:hypothetical protein